MCIERGKKMYKFIAKVKKGTAIVTHKEMDNADFLFEMKEENGLISAYLTAKKDIKMHALELETEKAFAADDLFYVNGYQSWSTSREFNKYGELKDILPLGRKLGKFAARCCGIMSDYEFECALFVYKNKKVIIPKSRMIKVDDDNYIVKLEDEDAIRIGRGKVSAEITAHIPDADFSDGLRTEKLRLCTDVMIV